MSTRTAKSGRRNQPQTAAAGKKSKGGKQGRKPIAPVRVGKERNWGPIAMFAAVGIIAAAIIGWAAFGVSQTDTRDWQERADSIADIVVSDPETLSAQHVGGVVDYPTNPPVGGDHNDFWQNCTGIVYEAPIASEHAVHSMEHGAVWITYSPDLPADQVDALASKVRGTDYTMLSPFEGLDAPISLQAWGYQLKVEDAGDERVDEFIRALRINASQEPGATCGGPNSVSTTGSVPSAPGGQAAPQDMDS